MNGTQPRPADLEWFMHVLAINHSLSSQEQQLLDQLVLSRQQNSGSLFKDLEEMRGYTEKYKKKYEDQLLVSVDLQDRLNEVEEDLEYKYNEVAGLEERVHELQEEASKWESLTIKLGGKLDEAEGYEKELEEMKASEREREWKALLASLVEGSKGRTL